MPAGDRRSPPPPGTGNIRERVCMPFCTEVLAADESWVENVLPASPIGKTTTRRAAVFCSTVATSGVLESDGLDGEKVTCPTAVRPKALVAAYLTVIETPIANTPVVDDGASAEPGTTNF